MKKPFILMTIGDVLSEKSLVDWFVGRELVEIRASC